jgi:hypothetical protein
VLKPFASGRTWLVERAWGCCHGTHGVGAIKCCKILI